MPDIQITKNTSISLGLVIIIVGAGIAWGILTTKVVQIEQDINDLGAQVSTLDTKLDQLIIDRYATIISY